MTLELRCTKGANALAECCKQQSQICNCICGIDLLGLAASDLPLRGANQQAAAEQTFLPAQRRAYLFQHLQQPTHGLDVQTLRFSRRSCGMSSAAASCGASSSRCTCIPAFASRPQLQRHRSVWHRHHAAFSGHQGAVLVLAHVPRACVRVLGLLCRTQRRCLCAVIPAFHDGAYSTGLEARSLVCESRCTRHMHVQRSIWRQLRRRRRQQHSAGSIRNPHAAALAGKSESGRARRLHLQQRGLGSANGRGESRCWLTNLQHRRPQCLHLHELSQGCINAHIVGVTAILLSPTQCIISETRNQNLAM